MNSTNFCLIIFITILAVQQSCSQYGDLDEEVKAIKVYQKKLGEFVDRYTKDVDQFKQAQAQVGKDNEFIKFEKNLMTLYRKTIKTTTDIMNDLIDLKTAPKDIAGDVIRLHHQFVETREAWDVTFKQLWADYSAILNSQGAEEGTLKEQKQEKVPSANEQPEPKPEPQKVKADSKKEL